MSFPINTTLAAASTGYVNATIGGSAFNINIVLTSFTGSGTLSIKYINQASDTGATSSAWCTIPVNSGKFLNGLTTYTLVNGSVCSSPYIQFSWVPSGTVTGSFLIQGVSQL